MYAAQERPAIHLPFPEVESPFMEDIQRETLKWVFRFHLAKNAKLFKTLESARLNERVARCYPNSPYQILQVINDWETWFFILDDLFDQRLTGAEQRLNYSYEVVSCLMESEIPAGRTDDPLFVALCDVWQRTQNMASLDWLMSFVDHLLVFFDARIWQALDQTQGKVPVTSDYIHEQRKMNRVAITLGWALLIFRTAVFHRVL
jgi:hypothetical protein